MQFGPRLPFPAFGGFGEFCPHLRAHEGVAFHKHSCDTRHADEHRHAGSTLAHSPAYGINVL